MIEDFLHSNEYGFLMNDLHNEMLKDINIGDIMEQLKKNFMKTYEEEEEFISEKEFKL